MATERIDIVISERGSRVVKRNLNQVGQTSRQAGAGVDFLRNALATLGVGLGIWELTRFLDVSTQLENRLRATGLEGQRLNAVYQELRSSANATRSGLQGTVELYSRLAISSKELGVSQRQLIDFTTSLNQAILLSGASATEAEAGLIQLSQGMASGTLRGDELRSVLEQLPAVADVIAKELGVTRGELRQMGEDGKITADIILEAFKNARGELADRFAKTVPTIGQSLTVLRNEAINLFREFEQGTAIGQTLAGSILFLAENLDVVAKSAIAASSGLLLIGGASKAVDVVTASVVRLNAAIAANPVGFLLIALTSAITALTLFRDQINLGVDDITTLGDLLRAFGEIVGGVLSDLLSWAEQTFGPLIGLVRDWWDEVDLSVMGILRIVASAVDSYIGLWVGAINAVIELFRGLPAALDDIFTRALNFMLDKIGSFVNKAGELLSTVTEFAGLGRIAAVDLQIEANNEGAAREIGAKIGEAFRDGYGSVNLAGGFLDRLEQRAQEIARERTAAEAGGDVDLTGVPGRPGGGGQSDEQLKALQDLQKELDQLLGQYNGVYAAQRQYEEAVATLSAAEQAGMVSSEQKAAVLEVVRAQLEDSLDPIAALNRGMDKELELLGLTADAREVENQLRSVQQDLLGQGIILSDRELAQMRERLRLIQEETDAAAAREAAYNSIIGPIDEYNARLRAANQLMEEGLISRGEAAEYILASEANLLQGTTDYQEMMVQQYQQTYERIDELRQNDIISEQAAAQMKAKLDADLAEKRLANASSFFGNLTALSRSENRTLSAIGKAAAVTQATIDGVVAVQKALASAPPPVNYALAASVGVATAANVAQIMAQTPGFAFGGDFSVGGTGGTDSQMVAFRATPGERVTVSTPQQERDRERSARSGEGGGNNPNIRVLNVVDPNLLEDYMSTPDGEQVLINTLRRNADALRGVLS